MRLKLVLIFLVQWMTVQSLAQPVSYSTDHVFERDKEWVDKSISKIQENFKLKFNLEVEVHPRLVHVDDEEDNHIFGNYSYHKIIFGKLSKEQFDHLNSYYQFPIPSKEIQKKQYEPNKVYELVDFLLPKIQPLSGKQLWAGVPTHTLESPHLSDRENTFFNSNCWSTVHDILVSDQLPFKISGFVTDSHYMGSNVRKIISDDNFTENITKRQDQDLKAYDVFIQPDGDGIFHTGVFVGPGLIFEKLGLGGDEYLVSPFLVHWEKERADEFRKKWIFRRLINSITITPAMISSNDEITIDDIYWENLLEVEFNTEKGRYGFASGRLSEKLFMPKQLQSCDFESMEKKLCKKSMSRDFQAKLIEN